MNYPGFCGFHDNRLVGDGHRDKFTSRNCRKVRLTTYTGTKLLTFESPLHQWVPRNRLHAHKRTQSSFWMRPVLVVECHTCIDQPQNLVSSSTLKNVPESSKNHPRESFPVNNPQVSTNKPIVVLITYLKV